MGKRWFYKRFWNECRYCSCRICL